MQFDITSQDRAAIGEMLLDGASDHDAAYALLMRLAHNAVASIRRDLDTTVANAARFRRNTYVYLLAPLPKDAKPTILQRLANGHIEMEARRQPYRVALANLPAFAKEQGLDYQAIEDVAYGRRGEYRGWTQAAGSGTQPEVGTFWRDREKQPAATGKPAYKIQQQDVVALPTVTYQPKEAE